GGGFRGRNERRLRVTHQGCQPSYRKAATDPRPTTSNGQPPSPGIVAHDSTTCRTRGTPRCSCRARRRMHRAPAGAQRNEVKRECARCIDGETNADERAKIEGAMADFCPGTS